MRQVTINITQKHLDASAENAKLIMDELAKHKGEAYFNKSEVIKRDRCTRCALALAATEAIGDVISIGYSQMTNTRLLGPPSNRSIKLSYEVTRWVFNTDRFQSEGQGAEPKPISFVQDIPDHWLEKENA